MAVEHGRMPVGLETVAQDRFGAQPLSEAADLLRSPVGSLSNEGLGQGSVAGEQVVIDERGRLIEGCERVFGRDRCSGG
jgi:hypothetical protein